MLRKWHPANFTKARCQDNYDVGYYRTNLEMLDLTPDQPSVESLTSYCEQLDGQRWHLVCNSTATEYTQPYMAPGLFASLGNSPLDVVKSG